WADVDFVVQLGERAYSRGWFYVNGHANSFRFQVSSFRLRSNLQLETWNLKLHLRGLPVIFFEAAFVEQEFDELGVESVAAFVGDEVADEVAAGEREVADEIQSLVADALVFHPHFVVDRAFGTENEQVLIGHAEAKTTITQPLGFFGQNER